MERVRLASGVLLVVVLVSTVPTVGAATPERGGTLTQTEAGTGVPMAQTAENASGAESEPTVVVNKTFSLTPEQPGAVRVRLRVSGRNLDSLDSFTVWLRNAGDIRDVDGFSVSGTKVTWTNPQLSSTATLTYTKWVNRTGADVPYIPFNGSLAVDSGSWALFDGGTAGYGFNYDGETPEVNVRYEHATAGPGAVGSGRDSFVYLGPHEEFVKRAHGQRFRLIVPKAADFRNESRVLSTVAKTSGHIRFGSRDDSVLMIAAPQTVDWALAGMGGNSSLYTVTGSGLDTWIHEYVHTRQTALNVESGTRWLIEATASYYDAYDRLRQGMVGFGDFKDTLAVGENETHDDTRLAKPSSYGFHAPYEKGALVVGVLDRQIRLATDGRATFQTVLKRLAAVPEANQSQFLRVIESVAGERVRRLARKYTETTATPSMWSLEEHKRAFPPLPATFRVSKLTAYVARGGTNYTLSERAPLTNEPVYVTVTVRNVGGQAGTHTVKIRRVDRVIETKRVRLAPNETVTVRAQTRFQYRGYNSLIVNGHSVEVHIKKPAPLRLRWVSAKPRKATVGESVTVTVSVRNAHNRPGMEKLTIIHGNETVLTDRIRIEPQTITTLSTNVTLSHPGVHYFDVRLGSRQRGDRVKVINRSTPANTATPTDTRTTDPTTPTPTSTGGQGPGFGALAASVALLVAALRWRR